MKGGLENRTGGQKDQLEDDGCSPGGGVLRRLYHELENRCFQRAQLGSREYSYPLGYSPGGITSVFGENLSVPPQLPLALLYGKFLPLLLFGFSLSQILVNLTFLHTFSVLAATQSLRS